MMEDSYMVPPTLEMPEVSCVIDEMTRGIPQQNWVAGAEDYIRPTQRQHLESEHGMVSRWRINTVRGLEFTQQNQ
jgi:hypothetical protein